MDRRAFITGMAGGLLAAPLAAEAQPARKVPVVGILNIQHGSSRSLSISSVRQGLSELGYVEGQTIAFELRFAGMKPETFPGLAADLVRRKVDVVLAIGPQALRAARDATSTIPIVAIDFENDPVQAGFARSLAHPGGNTTGLFLDQPGLTGKCLELIEEAAPGTRRIAVLVDTTTGGPWQLTAIKAGAEKLGIELHVLEIRGPGDLDRALGAGLKRGSQALIQLTSPLFDISAIATQIADFAVRHRLPAISMLRSFAMVGGLMAYGPNQLEYLKRPPVYIDKILKGAKPGDLPIEHSAKFDFVINLKTARALGLTIPPSLLARADEVIQ